MEKTNTAPGLNISALGRPDLDMGWAALPAFWGRAAQLGEIVFRHCHLKRGGQTTLGNQPFDP